MQPVTLVMSVQSRVPPKQTLQVRKENEAGGTKTLENRCTCVRFSDDICYYSTPSQFQDLALGIGSVAESLLVPTTENREQTSAGLLVINHYRRLTRLSELCLGHQ